MRLQRAPLRGIQRACCEPLHGDAVQPVAENELFGQPVARREQRLLDLCGGEPELGGRLVDPKPMHLAQHIDAALPVGQRGERLEQRTGERLAFGGCPLGQRLR